LIISFAYLIHDVTFLTSSLVVPVRKDTAHSLEWINPG
jgi:hypothetical protein